MKVLGFLWPGTRKFLLFIVLTFICVAGAIQTFVFIDDVPGVEKPPFFEQLRPFDFWLPWIMFTAPFHIPVAIVCSRFDFCTPIFSHFPRLGEIMFPVSSVLYSYLAASWFIYSWDRWISEATLTKRRLLLLIPLVATAIIVGPTIIFVPLWRWKMSHSISSFFLAYFILTFYAISCYGLYRVALKMYLKKIKNSYDSSLG